MKVRNLFTDDDAVSPVIGVILMVAITVILAAVIGAFVLNIGGSQENSPQVTWEWSDDAADDQVSLAHGGGDRVDNPGQMTLSTDVTTGTITDSSASLSENYDGTETVDKWSAGTELIVINADGGDIVGTVDLVWESSDGSDSQIISTHEFDTS